MVAPAAQSSQFRVRNWLSPWSIGASIIAIVLLGPIASVFIAAMGGSLGLWEHLSQTVLPRYVINTIVLMVGVAIFTLVFGLSAAWTVVRFDFPGQRIFEWMLLLPAAVPAYIIAYVYTDFLEFAGPVQGILRDLLGWTSDPVAQEAAGSILAWRSGSRAAAVRPPAQAARSAVRLLGAWSLEGAV